MAFHQPTQPPQRQYNPPPPQSQHALQTPLVDHSQLSDQEWILFSPTSTASTTNETQTTSTARTRHTLGHSRNSAFGSLDTAARSYEYDQDDSEQTEAGILDDDNEEEEEELDSLDSHLHEFRADPSVYRASDNVLNDSANAVLPTHDGLGSFRIDSAVMGEGVQQHLYSFEHYNPRRVKRRREGMDAEHIDLEADQVTELERTRRIEAWRLEQSRALLEEIQRESRRRRQSMRSEPRSLLHDTDDADAASMSADVSDRGHKEDGLWSRITRRVIEDLMGIDDNLLSILFGESLPQEAELSSTPTTLAHTKSMQESSWEYRLLDRVAKEIGLLISQLSDHPDTFSDYVTAQNQPLPYAGLPVIPEKTTSTSRPTSSSTRYPSNLSSDTPHFHPTLPAAIAIPGSSLTNDNQEEDIDATPRAIKTLHSVFAPSVAGTSRDITKDEWEKQLDIKMVFRYLRSRFISRDSSPEPLLVRNASFPLLSPTNAAHPHHNEAQAARVRQNHPLVSRHAQQVSRTALNHRRNSSSCASFKRESLRSGGSSSRHYWDLGGSLGSGSLVASGGNLGAWGEV